MAWRAEPGADAMLSELQRYGAGAPLEHCPQLETIFTECGEAERLMRLLSQHYCAAIRANPIGHPPFRTGFDGRASSTLLARSGRAQLMVQTREPGTYGAESITLSDATRYDAVLAGRAEARILRAHSAGEDRVDISAQAMVLTGKERIALDRTSETLVVDVVERRLVTLQLMRDAADPEPKRSFNLKTGRLVSQSAASVAISRQEAMIALLGRMGRRDAAPELARIALAAKDVSLRWQALRECIALDSACGFCTLARVARTGDDPLAAAAGALRAQLLETYPEFARLEADRCPA